MILKNWWHERLRTKQIPVAASLNESIETDFLIVGGGAAGMAAAGFLHRKKASFVLLEKEICGGSSTGKSAGFLTPDSELELAQLIRRFGKTKAEDLWNAAVRGVDVILKNIEDFRIECDLETQDSLYVGIGKSGKKDVLEEFHAQESLGFSSIVFDSSRLRDILGSAAYTAGMAADGMHVITALLYVQGLKKSLIREGARIFENSEVLSMDGNTVYTKSGNVKAKKIIFAADKLPKNLQPFNREIFTAQTYLSVSEPMPADLTRLLFPKNRMQCWDSDVVYTYFRMTAENRLLIGGSNKLATYAPVDINNDVIIKDVIRNFKSKFPFLSNLEFEYFWQGRIDTTKDLIPLVAFSPASKDHLYVSGCVGLPWASFCGEFAAKHFWSDGSESEARFFDYFDPHRSTFIPGWLDPFLGKQLVFSLNSLWSKYYQR